MITQFNRVEIIGLAAATAVLIALLLSGRCFSLDGELTLSREPERAMVVDSNETSAEQLAVVAHGNR